MPSFAELDGPVTADVETYAQAANADAPYRIKLFRLAFDAAVSSFAGRQQLYERYYSGDPVRLAGALYNLYDKDAPIARTGRGSTPSKPAPKAEDHGWRRRPLLETLYRRSIGRTLAAKAGDMTVAIGFYCCAKATPRTKPKRR